MSELIKLVKGDIHHLEGRVVVYAKLSGYTPSKENLNSENSEDTEYMPKEGDIFALYATRDIDAFCEKTGTSREKIEKEIRADKIKKEKMLSVLTGKKINLLDITLVGPIPISSEQDLFICPEDVVFVGEHSHPVICFDAVKNGLEFYFLNLAEQEIFKKKKPESKTKEINRRTYVDIEGKELIGYINQQFLVPILEAIRHNEHSQIEGLTNAFVYFSKGSSFERDVKDLCTLLADKDKLQTEIIEAYLHKIRAIHTEDYDEAAKRRDEINRLREKS